MKHQIADAAVLPLGEGRREPRIGLIRWIELAVVAIVLGGIGMVVHHVQAAAPPEVLIAGFATSLQERTASQQHNARKAAAAIDGIVIKPGQVFSFNKTVKSWTADRGYVKAPVSYDGDLIKEYGGGVCQTSTTLYNAALLAGLPMLERHCHAFAPHYVPPGRDAAVAQYDIDLQFKNPYPWPIRIRAAADDMRLNVEIVGSHKPATSVFIESKVLSTVEPQRLTRVSAGGGGPSQRRYLRNPGAFGCRAVTFRVFSQNDEEIRREQLGDDTYQAMNRVVQVTED